MSKCPICASENGPNDRFCRACGAAFTVRPTAAQPADDARGAVADAVPAATVAPVAAAADEESTAPVAAAAVVSAAVAPSSEPRVDPEAPDAPESGEPPRQRRSAWMIMVVVIPLLLLCGACAVMSLIGRML